MNLKNIRLNNMLAAGIIAIAAYSLIVILQSFSETYQIAFAFFDQLNSSYPFIFIFIIVSVPLSFGFIAYLVYIDKTTLFSDNSYTPLFDNIFNLCRPSNARPCGNLVVFKSKSRDLTWSHHLIHFQRQPIRVCEKRKFPVGIFINSNRLNEDAVCFKFGFNRFNIGNRKR